MDSMAQVDGPIQLGLDVSRNVIVVGILLPGQETPAVDRIAHDEASVRRLGRSIADARVPHPRGA